MQWTFYHGFAESSAKSIRSWYQEN